MAEQYVNRTVTYDEYRRVNPSSGSTTMIEAQFATRGKQSFSKWEVCPICGFSYKQSEMIKVGGAFYCTRFNHYIDAKRESAGQL